MTIIISSMEQFSFVSQIRACKSDSRECIATLRFRNYRNFFPKLVDDDVPLRLACCHGNRITDAGFP